LGWFEVVVLVSSYKADDEDGYDDDDYDNLVMCTPV